MRQNKGYLERPRTLHSRQNMLHDSTVSPLVMLASLPMPLSPPLLSTVFSAAEMETEQTVLVRIASLEGRLSDIRAVVSLLLSAQPVSPPCADVPLPLFLCRSPRLCVLSRPIQSQVFHASGRCTFWL